MRDDRARPRGVSGEASLVPVESGRPWRRGRARGSPATSTGTKSSAGLPLSCTTPRVNADSCRGDFSRNVPSIEEVVGVGVDIPQHNPYPRMPGARRRGSARRATSRKAAAADAADDESPARAFPSHLLARGAVFRRRHRLHGSLLLVRRTRRSGTGLRGASRILQPATSSRVATRRWRSSASS